MINVGMVLGMPVIGIPLPFLSMAALLWSFTILLFILLRLDASRLEPVKKNLSLNTTMISL